MDSKIIAFAINAHNNVNHLYDGNPYSVHLSMVSMYAMRYMQIELHAKENTDYSPVLIEHNILSACWLHDTIEDCRMTYNDIFTITANAHVSDIVYALTNEKGKTRSDRANESYYKGIRDTKFAIFVKLCDRLANVRYSYDKATISNVPRMLGVYRSENEKFIKALCPTDDLLEKYKPMISEIQAMLGLVSTK